MDAMWHKLNSLKADLLIVTIILIGSLKFTLGVQNSIDVWLYDESTFLYDGIKLASNGFRPAEEQPLYSIWYWIVSLFEANRINLYYLNLKLMTILPPILAYILLRINRVSIPVSLIISWLLLVVPANWYTMPKGSHFALILILAALIVISSRSRSFLWTSLFVSISALMVSYARPEYFLTYLLSVLLVALAVGLEYKKLERRHLAGLIACGLASAILLGVLGLPISGSRSMGAFRNLFSYNWISWTGSDMSPWTNSREIASRNFGRAQNIPEAFANNPKVFLRHVTCNIRELPKASARLALPPFLPKDIPSERVAELLIIGLFVANISRVRKNLLEYKRSLIFVALFLPPGLFSIVLLWPRDNYILIPLVLTSIAMTILAGSRTFEQKQVNYKGLLLLGLFVIAVTPYFTALYGSEQPTLHTIRFIQSLRIEKSVNLLEAEGGFDMYLSDNFHRVAEYDKDIGFNRFISDRNINMIVVTTTLLRDTRFRNDIEWLNFLTDYPKFGYLQMDIPKTDRKLIMRVDLSQR
jgi:hypothetical protein